MRMKRFERQVVEVWHKSYLERSDRLASFECFDKVFKPAGVKKLPNCWRIGEQAEITKMKKEPNVDGISRKHWEHAEKNIKKKIKE